MIKFFRKIRRSLIIENKTAQYVKYALGEVVLVMIGILLALQVNNWNEERKADRAENKALLALKKEFDQNIDRLEYICTERDSAQAEKREFYDLITDDMIPIETRVNANVDGFYGARWAAQNTVLNGLVNSGTIDNIKNDSLKTLLTLWPNVVRRWENEEEKYASFSEKWKDYTRSRIRQGIPITIDGKKKYVWKDTWEEHKSRMTLIIDDLEYQNFVASEIQILYQQSVVCSRIMKNYEQISSLLNLEIKNRKIN